LSNIDGIVSNGAAINRYHTSRKEIREELPDISDVPEYYAKELFIRIFFGGSIETWKKDNTISIETTLPTFVYDLEREIFLKYNQNFLSMETRFSL
jgi:hypothetical protein